MATVYLALQKSVDREVAIKVMSPRLSQDPGFGSRFYREAKIVGQLSHPNIVSIYDVGSYKQYNFIAMDFLPGLPLAQRIAQGMTANAALKVTREIAAALDYAHQRGYVHRDIKPDNILFRADDSAVLTDFGIAKALKNDLKMTQAGDVLGTPHYMSPEQAQDKRIDGRADLYSLGIVLFEMLTGEVPFNGDDAVAIAIKHISASVPKLPANLRFLQPLVNRLLAKKPAARFQTGQELIAAIHQLEQRMGSGQRGLTTSNTGAVHSYLLLRALIATLAATLTVSVQKLLNRKRWRRVNPALNEQQLADIDEFVLGDNNEAPTLTNQVYSPTATQRRSRRWLYLPAGAIGLSLALFIYAYDNHHDSVQQIAQQSLYPLPLDSDFTVAEPAPDTMPLALEARTVVRSETTLPEARQQPLLITTEPADARVRILNIRPRYMPNIQLEKGRYHIEVSAENYHSQRFWLTVDDQPVSKAVKLEPTRRLLAAGTVFNDLLKDKTSAPAMVIIPPEADRSSVNKIAVGITEVSFAQFDVFCDSTGYRKPSDYGWGRGSRPVVDISYRDAVAYSQWLSEQTGSHYRLPTAQEWQFAASAGTGKDFWWDDQNKQKIANCRRGCDSDYSGLFSSQTAPVASYPANPFGLFDTAGNVSEWLACDLTDQPCQQASAAGGSHKDRLSQISSRHLEQLDADKTYKQVGFRLVVDL